MPPSAAVDGSMEAGDDEDRDPGSCGGLWRFSWEKHGIFMGKPWKNMEKTWKKHGKTMENTWQTWGFDGGFNGIYRKKPKHVCDGKPKKWKVEMGQVHDFFFVEFINHYDNGAMS
jgi:hypothetical protein